MPGFQIDPGIDEFSQSKLPMWAAYDIRRHLTAAARTL